MQVECNSFLDRWQCILSIADSCQTSGKHIKRSGKKREESRAIFIQMSKEHGSCVVSKAKICEMSAKA
jgi:hypothetical protein